MNYDGFISMTSHTNEINDVYIIQNEVSLNLQTLTHVRYLEIIIILIMYLL